MAGTSRTVTLNVIGNASGASKALDDVAGKSESTAKRASAAFGGVLSTLNSSGVLGPLGESLDKVSGMFDKVGEHGKNLGKTLMGVGAAGVGIGGILTAAAGPDQAAAQQLQAAIGATGHSIDEYKEKIESSVKSNEKFGATANITQDAIRILTQQTGDASKAIGYMGVVSDLAAAKHVSLDSAATMVAKTLDGNTKILKGFGLEVEKTVDYTKQLASAQTAATAADTTAGTAKQHLADVQAQVAAKVSAAVDAASKAQSAAQDKVNTLLGEQADAANKVTTAQDRLTNASQSVVAAQQSVQDATQKVADAQQKLTDALSSENKMRAQQNASNSLADASLSLRSAQFGAADAQKKLTEMQSDGKSTADDLAHQQLAVDEANQRLVESQQSVADAQDKANTAAKVGTDLDPAVIAAKQGVTVAVDGLTKSQQGVTKATEAETQAKFLLAQAGIAQTALTAKITTAQDALTAATNKVAAAHSLTATETGELKKAQNDLTTADGKAVDAHKKVVTVQGEVADSAKAATDNVDKLGEKVAGQASAQADTFTGHLKAVRAEIEDSAASLGQKYGPALMGVSTLVSAAGGVLSMFSKTQKAAETAQEGLTVATEAGTVATDAAAASEGLALAPILLIVGAVVLVGVAIYELWTHWDTVWGWIKGAAETVWNWIQSNWPLLLGILTGPIGLAVVAIATHWTTIKNGFTDVKNWIGDRVGDVVGFFTGLGGKIATAATGMFDGVKDAFKSAFNWLIDKWNSLHFGLPSIDTHIPGVGKVGGFDVGVPQIPRFALGGAISGGQLSIVGENGPELFLPGSSGTIIPNHQLGGGTTVGAINVYAAPGQSVEQIANAVRSKLLQAGRGNVNVGLT
jgi:hypothetical protein